MTSTNTAVRLISDCPNCQKLISHCTDLGEYMMEAINRQWLRQFGNTQYFEHSASKPIINLVNPNLTLLEQWQIKFGQSFAPTNVQDILMPV